MRNIRDRARRGGAVVLAAAIFASMGAWGAAHAQPDGASGTSGDAAGGVAAPRAEAPHGTASARNGGEESAAESRSQAFRAVKGSRTKDIPGGPLLVAAYGVAWVLLLLFVLRLGRLHTMTVRELDRLERRMRPTAGDDERGPD